MSLREIQQKGGESQAAQSMRKEIQIEWRVKPDEKVAKSPEWRRLWDKLLKPKNESNNGATSPV